MANFVLDNKRQTTYIQPASNELATNERALATRLRTTVINPQTTQNTPGLQFVV